MCSQYDIFSRYLYPPYLSHVLSVASLARSNFVRFFFHYQFISVVSLMVVLKLNLSTGTFHCATGGLSVYFDLWKSSWLIEGALLRFTD